MLGARPVYSSLSDTRMPRELFGYEVLDFIGEGAHSLIYVVTDPTSHQIYAMKHIARLNAKDERFFQQLGNEFEVSRQFKHPILRRSIALKDNRSLLRKATEAALIMELFDGVPLDARRPTDLRNVVECFIQVTGGLAALHANGYIHCDIKPTNILIGAGGDAKIIDFGQACPMLSIKERIQGTPDFISPEQVRCEPVSARTDVFSLGATMYWTLAGRRIPTLFTLKRGQNSFLVDERIPTPHEVNETIPEPLSNLVMECVRTNPMRRPSDMSELARRLEIVQHVINRSEAAVA